VAGALIGLLFVAISVRPTAAARTRPGRQPDHPRDRPVRAGRREGVGVHRGGQPDAGAGNPTLLGAVATVAGVRVPAREDEWRATHPTASATASNAHLAAQSPPHPSILQARTRIPKHRQGHRGKPQRPRHRARAPRRRRMLRALSRKFAGVAAVIGSRRSRSAGAAGRAAWGSAGRAAGLPATVGCPACGRARSARPAPLGGRARRRSSSGYR
jgi:hypothetical protein